MDTAIPNGMPAIQNNSGRAADIPPRLNNSHCIDAIMSSPPPTMPNGSTGPGMLPQIPSSAKGQTRIKDECKTKGPREDPDRRTSRHHAAQYDRLARRYDRSRQQQTDRKSQAEGTHRVFLGLNRLQQAL